MLSSIWKDKAAIGRGEYFKNTLLIAVLQILFYIPTIIAEQRMKDGTPLSETTELLCALFALIGGVFTLSMAVKNIFKRARDIEGRQEISRWKWAFLAFFPIIAIYGQVSLLFKRGQSGLAAGIVS